jgi:hypothetical protein
MTTDIHKYAPPCRDGREMLGKRGGTDRDIRLPQMLIRCERGQKVGCEPSINK